MGGMWQTCIDTRTGKRFEFNDVVYSDKDACYLPARVTQRGITFLAKERVLPKILALINEKPTLFMGDVKQMGHGKLCTAFSTAGIA